MKKGKKVQLYFAKAYTGKCQEMLLSEVEINKGVARAVDPKNANLLLGQQRCEIEVPVVEKKEEPKSFVDDLIEKIGNKIKGYFE
jgi:predicted methyltransferase MtxX (methanogen marker protein 4)